MDFVHHALVATVTVPSHAVRSSDGSQAMPVKGSMKIETKWVDDRGYMTIPSSLSVLAGGARAVTLPASTSQYRAIDTTLSQSAVALTYAKILLGELTEQQTVHALGSRTIDGVFTSGTGTDLTLAQLLKLAPELSPAMTDDVGTMANGAISVTVWVDHRGRLIELTLAGIKGNSQSLSGTMQFSHYNAPITVKPPSAKTVKPIPIGLRRLLDGLYFY
jgi:hypothetical protein